MGYYTAYKLEVKCYKDAQEVKQISIEHVMEKIKNGGSQEEVLKELEHIKNGKENIVVNESMIIEDFINNNDNAKYALEYDGSTRESCKWYDSHTELGEFSKKYPNWLFVLTGEGEESGDLWKKYYLNGKVQEAKAQIIFDEFDEKKLKKVK